MKYIKTVLVVGMVALLCGCGENNTNTSGTKPSQTRPEVATDAVTPSAAKNSPVSAITAQSGVQAASPLAASSNQPAPTPPNACAILGKANVSGRLMGGARQCVAPVSASADNVQVVAEKHTGTPASFGTPTDITTDGHNLYVVDTFYNKIRKIVIATGEVTTLAGSGKKGATDGTGAAASFNEPVSITTDGSNLYVSDRENHKIRKIVTATGQVTTMAGSETYSHQQNCGLTATGFCFLGGITTDGDQVYVSDIGNHKIRKILIATGEVATLAGSGKNIPEDGQGGDASFFNPSGMTTDGKNLYVVDESYNGSSNIVRKIEIVSGRVTTLTDLGRRLGFFKPHIGITTDGGHLYVTSLDSNSIYRIGLASRMVELLAGSGNAKESTGGTGKEASFARPLGITSDGRNLYVADSGNHKIRKIEIASAMVTTLAGSNKAGDADGIGMTGYDLPSSGITTDGKYLFVSDPSSSTIRRVEIASGLVTTLTGGDSAGFKAGLNLPKGLIVEGGSLYVADYANHAIRLIDTVSGDVDTLAGAEIAGDADGKGKSSSFNYPYGIASDRTSLYVADYDNHAIRKIEIESEKVTTVAGSGKEGAANGTGKTASFRHPRGVAVIADNLYVADTFNHSIRRIAITTGKVTTLAGTGSPGFADGSGSAAAFSLPSGIVTDGRNLYIADTSNHAIRKIEADTGKVSTLAGSGKEGMADGSGTAASFSQPLDITLNGGSLYVADPGNHLIRKVDLATGAASTLNLRGASAR